MGGGAELELLLTGPQGVEAAKVERLEIQDGEPWANPVAPGATREELAVHVRGPYEFKSGLKGQTSGGRIVEPFTLTVGYPHKLLLRETSPPLNSGIPGNVWQQDVHTLPLRMALTCTQEGYDEPWRYVHPEIPVSNQLRPPQRL